jgi:hypothetical protein
MKMWPALAVCLLARGAFLWAQLPSPQPQQTPAPIAAAQPQARRAIAAARIDASEKIVLDGRLDELAWSRAVPANNFIQQDPDNGKPATEATEVRILFNKDALYMGVTCFDSEPDKWLGYQRRRDEFLQADDRFMWNIDTYNNQQSGYFFEMNPSGLMGDALRGATFQNRQWDGIWNAKARRSEIGWTLEIEIPFRTLNFDPKAEFWGINFQRSVKRKNEESVWMGWGRNQGLNRLSNAGMLTGLQDIQVGHGIDLKPYAVATAESFPGRGDNRTRANANAGLDLFYSPTPRLRANLTINTDFAQTEVDHRLTNLTRFPTFFPEKRDFFLDGSTFFDFQSTAIGNSVIPFFSRRIGLDAAGNPQKIDAGGKFAGQFGRTDVGALYVRTGREERGPAGQRQTIPGEDFAVVRAKRRILRQSYIGGLYTARSMGGSSSPNRQTAGGDFVLATSSFMGSEQLSLGGFFVNTTNPRRTGKNNSFGVQLDYPNDPWNVGILYREIQANYDAAVGFTPRTGIRLLSSGGGYTTRPKENQWIRTIQYAANLDVLSDTLDNRLLNRDVDFMLINVGMHSLDSFQVHVLPSYERLETDFEISPGIRLPRGSEYNSTRYQFSLATAQRRKIAFGPLVELGTFYSGTRRRYATTLNLRLRPGVIIYTSGEWNSVHLAEGNFHTRLFRVVPELQFSPWIAWVNNVQYDTQSSIVGWQSRFRWIMRPGNDFYIVYTHNWVDDPLQHRIYTLDRRAASKVLYTHRF